MFLRVKPNFLVVNVFHFAQFLYSIITFRNIFLEKINPSIPTKRVCATGRLMCWDGKLSLCDQHDVQVFTTLDSNIPTARGFHVVTDERTSVLVANRLKM